MTILNDEATATETQATDRPGAAAAPDAVTPPHADQRASKPSGTTFETLAVCGFIFGIFAIVVAVFAVGLAARAVDEAKGSSGSSASSAPAPAAAGGVETLDVSLKDFAIAPRDLRVSASAVLQITNDGAIPHDLAVDGVSSDMLAAGERGTLDLGALQPGTYTMVCQVPGHEAAGMKGTLVIR